MNKLVLAAALLAGAHQAHADSSGFKITVNGPHLTGMALPLLDAPRLVLTDVILPPAGEGAPSLVLAGDAKPTTPDPDPK